MKCIYCFLINQLCLHHFYVTQERFSINNSYDFKVYFIFKDFCNQFFYCLFCIDNTYIFNIMYYFNFFYQ